jgi:uncharacterized protein YjbI with pentapeptide repeats
LPFPRSWPISLTERPAARRSLAACTCPGVSRGLRPPFRPRSNLSQADLRGANLSDAILEDTVLSGAQADTSTIWPTDFNAQRRRELGVIEVGDNSLA